MTIANPPIIDAHETSNTDEHAPRSHSNPQPHRDTAVLLSVGETRGPQAETLLAVKNTVRLAECVHESLVSRVGGGEVVNCPELTGHDRRGRPLRLGHRHAHVLPVDLDRDARIDYILIWVPMGIGNNVMQAIESLQTLVTGNGQAIVPLNRVGFDHRPNLSRFPHLMVPLHQSPSHSPSQSPDLSRLDPLPSGCDRDNLSSPGGANQRVDRSHPEGDNRQPVLSFTSRLQRKPTVRVIEPSVEWISLTPFVPPRFVKPRGKNSLENQVQAELASRNMPPADSVEVVGHLGKYFCGFTLCRRSGKPQPPRPRGYVIRLTFPTAIFGPIALGYASHFGLGMFQAEIRCN